ncbi:MAG: hypothetical protein WCT42_02370 [Candidatus Paceibacterota bacterium]
MEKLENVITEKALTEQEVINLIKEFSEKSSAVINYDKSLLQTIHGKRLRINDVDINDENFPSEQSLKGEVVILTKLFARKDAGESCSQMIERMKEDGYHPASIIELISLNISEYHRQFHIYAYGSVFKNRRQYYVYPFIQLNEVGLTNLSTYLSENDRLLGVCRIIK